MNIIKSVIAKVAITSLNLGYTSVGSIFCSASITEIVITVINTLELIVSCVLLTRVLSCGEVYIDVTELAKYQ